MWVSCWVRCLVSWSVMVRCLGVVWVLGCMVGSLGGERWVVRGCFWVFMKFLV
jgi:hypothetical protein